MAARQLVGWLRRRLIVAVTVPYRAGAALTSKQQSRGRRGCGVCVCVCGGGQRVPGTRVARPEMAPRAHHLTGLLLLAASFARIEAVAQPAWARRAQVALPFCGLSDVGCAGDTPSCDCMSFLFKCDLSTSGCSPLTMGTSLLVVGTVLLLLCCCCGGAKSEGYEGALTVELLYFSSTAHALAAAAILCARARAPRYFC